MHHSKIDFESVQWVSLNSLSRVKKIIQGNRQFRLLELTKGYEEDGWCTEGHIGIVLDGDLDIDFNGVVESFHKGDALQIMNGEEEKHKPLICSDKVILYLVEDV